MPIGDSSIAAWFVSASGGWGCLCYLGIDPDVGGALSAISASATHGHVPSQAIALQLADASFDSTQFLPVQMLQEPLTDARRILGLN